MVEQPRSVPINAFLGTSNRESLDRSKDFPMSPLKFCVCKTPDFSSV